jgi:translation initiation factor eIF-2B subunit delta
MGNAIRWLKLEISLVDISTRDSDAKEHLGAAIDNFIRERITVADQVIATTASAKIVPGDVILTYAKSNIVLQTLLEAQRNHQKQNPSSESSFRVILIDSRPLFEARPLARSLIAAGIPVTYTLLSGLSHAITSATKVLLGAHAMMSNGRLYSRVGTAAVAMAAHAEDIPVIVCCESVKFTERVSLDSVVNNEIAPAEEIGCDTLGDWKAEKGLQLLNLMYDLTPAEYIQMVVTEYGSLPPSSVPVVYRLSTNT